MIPNNTTMDIFFNQSTISTSQGEIANMTSVHSTISPSKRKDENKKNEGLIASDILK